MTPGIHSSPVTLLDKTTLLITDAASSRRKRKRHVVTFSEHHLSSSILSRQLTTATSGSLQASKPQDDDDDDDDDTRRSSTWYTEDDYLGFERDVRRTIRIMRSQFTSCPSGHVTPDEQDSNDDDSSHSGSDIETSAVTSSCTCMEENDCCFRGLEKYETSLIHYNRKQRERAHKAAILLEQERLRQRRDDGDSAVLGTLHRLSRRISKGARQEALVLASRDATEQLMMRIDSLGSRDEPDRKRART